MNTLQIKDVKTIVENGELYRVIIYKNGDSDKKKISDRKLKNLLDVIEKTPAIEVVDGGKK
jgi:hypothetical protein